MLVQSQNLGKVHAKMKITPYFTHPQAIPGVYDFLLSVEYLKNVLVLPSFIMEVGSGPDLKENKKHPSLIVLHMAQGVDKGLLKWSNAFV